MIPTMDWIRTRWQKWNRRQKGAAVLAGVSALMTGLFFLTDGPAAGADQPMDGGGLFYLGVFVKLVAVLLLFVGGAVILRRWQSGRHGGGLTRQLRVVESVRLSPRQALHLVEVGNRRLLIGATDQTIAFLSAVENAELPACPEEGIPLDFGSLLRAFQREGAPSAHEQSASRS